MFFINCLISAYSNTNLTNLLGKLYKFSSGSFSFANLVPSQRNHTQQRCKTLIQDLKS